MYHVKIRPYPLSIIKLGSAKKNWAMGKIKLVNMKIFRSVKDIELRVGDKLHSHGKTEGIRANQDLTVIGISKPNIFTKQKNCFRR